MSTRENHISKAAEVRELVRDLPYFTVQGLAPLNVKEYYLKIILSRLKERGEVVSLKRGLYVSSDYLEVIKRKNLWDQYLEFISGVLYSPSYLSLEYVLNENNILSESSFGFSAMSSNKTKRLNNALGQFHYHSIKEELFAGFKVEVKSGLFIYKATVGKALFDFLYLRKNHLINQDHFNSLRINKDQVGEKDFQEFERYVELEGSKKMQEITKFYAG